MYQSFIYVLVPIDIQPSTSLNSLFRSFMNLRLSFKTEYEYSLPYMHSELPLATTRIQQVELYNNHTQI